MAANISIKTAPNSATKEEIQVIFDRQKAYAPTVAQTDYRARRKKLSAIIDWIESHGSRIEEALHQDFRKHPVETLATEIATVLTEARYARRKLKGWMKQKRVGTPLVMTGSSGYIRYLPKGQVLIMAPWNYPFNLVVIPLISAIAAGNVVMIKPSEMTPNTSGLIRQMISELFDDQEVAVVEGDAEIATHLLELPFNHIHFTGSPKIGRIVMKAAAEHLASVTLELGGKSPTVIDKTANVTSLTERIAWGKCLNKGQTCLAPDYVIVHHSRFEQFVKQFDASARRLYAHNGNFQESPHYARIVNAHHFNRLKELMEDAIEKGATILSGGKFDESEHFIEPTLLGNVNFDMRVMEEEIFGPLLPVLTYDKLREVPAIINSHPRPLAAYFYSRKKSNIEFLLGNTIAGDVVINDNLIHFAHTELPFGGVNNSGIGKSSGYSGFKSFSHQQSMLHQRFGTYKPIYPPYNKLSRRLLNLFSKLP